MAAAERENLESEEESEEQGGAAAQAAPEPSSETFVLENEDHTLANALRFFLNQNPHVDFCGYSIPHPADPLVNVRVQTNGEISAAEALRQACLNLKAACAHIKQSFRTAVAEKRAELEQDMQVDG